MLWSTPALYDFSVLNLVDRVVRMLNTVNHKTFSILKSVDLYHHMLGIVPFSAFTQDTNLETLILYTVYSQTLADQIHCTCAYGIRWMSAI